MKASQAVSLMLVLILIWDASGSVSYKGYILNTVSLHSARDVNLLLDLEKYSWIDLWSSLRVGHVTPVLIHPSMMSVVRLLLSARGLKINPVVMDIQTLIEKQKSMSVSRDGFYLYKYNDYQQIHDWLHHLTSPYTSYLRTRVIGKSYEGRNITAVYTGHSTDREKQVIMLQCGVHAREWIAPAVCINIINELVTKAYDPVVSSITDYFEWVIVPLSNPDGYEHSHREDRMWRKTRSPNKDSKCFGADINRNYDFFFGGKGTSDNPCAENYKGSHAFSEVETQALRDLVLSLKERLVMFVDVHSFGQVFVTPWSYDNVDLEDYEELGLLGNIGSEAAFQQTGVRYEVGQSVDLLGATAGSSDDWAKGIVGTKFVYTFELRDKGDYGFLLPAEQIEPTCKEIFAALVAMAQTMHSAGF